MNGWWMELLKAIASWMAGGLLQFRSQELLPLERFQSNVVIASDLTQSIN